MHQRGIGEVCLYWYRNLSAHTSNNKKGQAGINNILSFITAQILVKLISHLMENNDARQ